MDTSAARGGVSRATGNGNRLHRGDAIGNDGSLSLPLLTPRSAYRLRSAHLQVATQAGVPPAMLDSDADPHAEALAITLRRVRYIVGTLWIVEPGRIREYTSDHASEK
jgi:hypothetical protein